MTVQADTGKVRDFYSNGSPRDEWWKAHFDDAAVQVIDFFGGDGISLEGKRVADVGCGDGIIDLSVALKAKPDQLVGFDLKPTDVDQLTEYAQRFGDIEKLPDNLFFSQCGATSLPADDDSFDFVISWSAFEHILDPVAVLREIRRILKPDGVLFIQVWPFFDTAHGPHLVDWFRDGFPHYRYSDDEILQRVRQGGDQELASEMLDVFRTLNKISADDLHAALRKAGFRAAKLGLISELVHLPQEAAHQPFSRVAISGIKLLAIPAEPDDEMKRLAAAEAEAAHLGAERAEQERAELARRLAPPPTRSGRAARRVRKVLRRVDGQMNRWDPDGEVLPAQPVADDQP